MLGILRDKGSCRNFANFPTQVGTCFASGFRSLKTVLCPHPWRRALRRRCFCFCGTESWVGGQTSRSADLKCQQLQRLPSVNSIASHTPTARSHQGVSIFLLSHQHWFLTTGLTLAHPMSKKKTKTKTLSHHCSDLYFSLLAKLTSYHQLSNHLHFLFCELFADILWVFFYGA